MIWFTCIDSWSFLDTSTPTWHYWISEFTNSNNEWTVSFDINSKKSILAQVIIWISATSPTASEIDYRIIKSVRRRLSDYSQSISSLEIEVVPYYFPGQDNIVRVVLIKTADGHIKYSISKNFIFLFFISSPAGRGVCVVFLKDIWQQKRIVLEIFIYLPCSFLRTN